MSRDNVRVSTDSLLVAKCLYEADLRERTVPKWRSEVVGWVLLGTLATICLVLGAS